MIAQTDGELSFGPAYAPVGFTSAQVSQFDGSAEPVVRELIQNCLDAADNAGRPAEVRFVITDVSAAQLPGWSEYCEAFTKAKSERQKRRTKASHDEKMIIERIDGLITCAQVPVLLCADNGCGLDPQRMISLLTVGNTDKGEGGAGSFGLGHHAAFGASDLRYVLYGSRYSCNGTNGTISSGHAILATRTAADGQLLAPEGYWRRSEWSGTLWQDGKEFPTQMPEMLAAQLPSDTTGTVVAIAGFNDFHRDDDEATAAEQIMRVAAANFSAAVDEGRLSVEIVEREGQSSITNRETLTAALEAIANRKASPAGQITGSQAHAAWITLRDGAQLTPLPGVRVAWRSLDAARGEQTQVHLFRKGMWISSRIEQLLKRNFASTWPFDAVVILTEGELEELVRASEGPEHRGIKRQRLDKDQRRLLRERLAAVADALRVAVGERNDEEEYTPQSFATLDGHHIRKAEPVRRPRRQAGGGSQKTKVERGTKKTRGTRRERRRGTPRPGSIPSYRHVLRTDMDEGIIEVRLEYDENIEDKHTMGIRVRRASGADGTCEQPFPDDYLMLAFVEDADNGTASTGGAEGETELTLPAAEGERTLRIKLADAQARDVAATAHLLSVDIVKRIRPSLVDAKDSAEPPDSETTSAMRGQFYAISESQV